ncbi:hypothetical protein [uncultured Aquimarina sp.]|uniref:hypothetical protein n=1 Tax=uncultured Aquimarina sp. TaxID=575652 RepID=UPI002623EBD1|nr:hypothetical protein [uncultured Aquimarina sp.]
MKNIAFYNEEFEIHGISIPKFELKEGELVRIYSSRIYPENVPVNFDLTLELIRRFQNKKTDFPWARNYNQNSIIEYIKPLTIKTYLINKMHINIQSAVRIVDEIGITLHEKFEYLGFTKKKALIIKANFEKNKCILFDYYGVDAMGIDFLEKIINVEIERGKSAIAFDNLYYAHQTEPYSNITPIRIASGFNPYLIKTNPPLHF